MKQFVVPFVFSLVALGLTGGGFKVEAQHVHLVAGAESQLQGSKVRLVNGATYDTNSNISGGSPPTPACFFMSDDYPELYPSLYQSDVTFSALPGTIWTGGPAPGAAAPGAYIEAKVISVTGPAGAEFSLWQENEVATETTRLFTILAGTSGSTNRFNISEGYSTPDGPDPFGHVHGRRFTATKPGLYTVGFQLIDTSTAGTGGGPIHAPSAPTNYFYFQAGVYIDSMVKTNNTVTVQFGARAFRTYDLEANDDLKTTNWFKITIGQALGGSHSDLHYLSDTNPAIASRFYRLQEIQ